MLPASDVSAPFGMRMPTVGICSNESGIESSRTFTTDPPTPVHPDRDHAQCCASRHRRCDEVGAPLISLGRAPARLRLNIPRSLFGFVHDRAVAQDGNPSGRERLWLACTERVGAPSPYA